MHVYRTLAALQALNREDDRGCVATIGSYDGIHLGHQAVISEVRARAADLGVPSLVFSFEPLPREYFNPNHPPGRLTRFRERAELLSELGVDRFFCPRFDSRLQQIGPAQFVEDMLVRGIRPRCVVVGDDFRFARGRAGTVEDLRSAGQRFGFEVVELGSIVSDDRRISSSDIREALAAGDMARATSMLGRPYTMGGRIKHGKHLGRKLGFPTANVDPGRRACPVSGVFAVWVHGLGDAPHAGVANVGTRPTVHGNGEAMLETHLFDFDRDIYGELIKVEFVARIRDEMKFKNLDALIEQINKDCTSARQVLGA